MDFSGLQNTSFMGLFWKGYKTDLDFRDCFERKKRFLEQFHKTDIDM